MTINLLAQSLPGSARAPACTFRRPRRNALRMAIPKNEHHQKKFAKTRASSPAREARVLPR